MKISLAQIPTLRDLYKSAVLYELEGEELSECRYEPRDVLLDKVSLYQGDITTLEVDSIVNAANKSLLGGGGVDGAIHYAAGPDLLAECRTLSGCDTGDAKITWAYDLPSRHILHTVGPIYSSRQADIKAKQLESCYSTCLEIAEQISLKHVAFPSISTGVYGYPIEDATHIALDTIRSFLDTHSDKFDRIIFVVWSDADKHVYEDLIPLYFPMPQRSSD